MRRITLLALLALSFQGMSGAAAQSTPAAPAVVCRKVESGSRGPCSANEFLLRRLDGEGLAAALAALDSLGRVDPEVRRLGHAYAHSIGIAAYDGTARVGDVFAACTPIFQSGCFHGVIQAYFQVSGQELGGKVPPETVNALCADQRADPALRWQLFQCAHGLGHGLMMAEGNHLPSALAACDLVEEPWERETCYSAVFMENVVQATSGEGALGRPGASAHVHVAPPQGATDFPPLDRDDPLYPCSVLDDRFLPACYQMQTSAILNLNGFDVPAAAEACAGAPEPFRQTCFQSLGRDISGITVQEHREALRLCGRTPAAYRPFCHLGYAKNLVDVTADASPGFAFCRVLEDSESKRLCYVGMGEELWVLEDDPVARARGCEAAEPAYVGACRLGASLEPLASAAPPR